jgi:Na+/proline symporter
MTLTTLDWLVLAFALGTPIALGIAHGRRSGRSLSQFFLSGRDLPWWMAGTSMVATTFAADTPLAVTGIVAASGIAGNWLWWNAALGSMLTVVLFARLWRRAGILTDVEFAELRYTGRAATVLRAARALYLGLPVNCLVIGWVNLALAKVLSIALGWERLTGVLAGLGATGVYAALAGLRGVVAADLLQFAIALTGAVALAWYALAAPGVGGLEGLSAALPASTFRLLPAVETTSEGFAGAGGGTLALPVVSFIAYLGIQWWASWYPGQEPGGGGYVAQRMMSARGERDAVLAALWFTVAHYCLRPWPWVLVALAALVLYPNLSDPEAGYVLVLRDHVPPGWRGLLVGAFFAAYMSTVSTQLNWGTSYLVNDVYKRFVRPDAEEAHLVRASRFITLVVMVVSGALIFYLESVRQAWEFVLESGAGVGLVLILRWYWWRVTAISELAALAAAAAGFLFVRLFTAIPFPDSLLYLVPWTTACWLTVTLVTRPEPLPHLIRFYRRTRPGGPGWRRIALAAGEPEPAPLAPELRRWGAGCAAVYLTLAGAHAGLFGSLAGALLLLACAIGLAVWLVRSLNHSCPNDD